MALSTTERYALLLTLRVEISPVTCQGSMSTLQVIELLKKSFDSGTAVQRVDELLLETGEHDEL